ncbi:MAG: hypothetical protein OHK0046_28610 [Anaerolineae bacterium]
MIVVDWGDADDALIVWRFEGPWTPKDYYIALERVSRLVAAKQHRVNVMVDVSQAALPRNAMALANKGFQARPANLGLIVVITDHTLWHMLYEMITRMSGIDYGLKFVNTIDEAYLLLGEAADEEART